MMEIHSSQFHVVSGHSEASQRGPEAQIQVVRGSEHSVSTASSRILGLASSWIQDRVATHEGCSPTLGSTATPSRLLEITGDGGAIRIRVVNTDQTFQGVK